MPAKTQARISCPRCCGKGEFPQFRHVEGGVCFLCRGRCHIPAGWTRGSRLSPQARSLVVQVAESGGQVPFVPAMAPAVQELYKHFLVLHLKGEKLALTEDGFKSYRKALAAGLVKPNKTALDAMRTVLEA